MKEQGNVLGILGLVVILLAIGCSAQVEPPPAVDEEIGTEASATVTLLDEGPIATVITVKPTPEPTPTATLQPTPMPPSTETPAPTPTGVTLVAPSLVEGIVTNVVDGDTIEVLIDGQEYRVRYIGVDTPETVHPILGVEPYGREASDYNKALVMGQTVLLEKDVSETDQFGRLLRYVWLDDETMVNALLVSGGYAQVSTFPPDVKHIDDFLELERVARQNGIGLWGSTPEPVQTETPEPVQGGDCDPSYPDVCIPSPPPDLDCGDIEYRRFDVLPPDPHGFDGDQDGVGCES